MPKQQQPQRRRPASQPPAQQPRPIKRGVLAAVALGVLGVLAIIGVIAYMRPRPAQATLTRPNTARCGAFPAFAQRLGFSTSAVMDTTDRIQPGLRIVEQAQGQPPKVYQAPDWAMAGYLGLPVIDNNGDIYVAPAPRVNLLLNPAERQNTIYKIDGATGAMQPFLAIPPAQPAHAENPYGILGLALDCQSHALYVSTVAGSTREQEYGQILRIDIGAARVTSQIDAIDAFGVGVGREASAARLYFARARTAEIWSVALDAGGNFSGAPMRELTYGRALNDGDGRARKISFDAGIMNLTIIPFTYTLAPLAAAQQTIRAAYDPQVAGWVVQK
ncbi:MAG: hypothetical protein IPP13_23350 [Kouleothrix sp.]|jgi:hypothetical protein|nr:hypothetical protein [Kouleothrix sp.]